VETLTLVAVLGGLALILIDLFVPSGGLLSGTGIALMIERGLAALGVAGSVRWPLAGFAMLVTVGLVIRFGERLSERLFPPKIKTNLDRLVGLRGRVHRVEGPVVELEGDLWTARLAGPYALEAGEAIEVVDFIDQQPVVRPLKG
jgi:membrane protein implicated in regulation of membrane protease activity